MLTGINATFDDLYRALGRMTASQRSCLLTVELEITGELLSSSGGATLSRVDVGLDVAGINHDILESDHPVIVIQW